MDATTSQTIIKAMEILGPAIIVAWSTYKVAMVQVDIKLRELEKKQEFGVRKQLFNYYKEREISLSKSYEAINGSLNMMLGYATGIENTGIEKIDRKNNENFLTMFEFAELEARKTLLEIDTTAMYMEQEDFKDTNDYNKLKTYIEPLKNLETEKTLQGLRKNTLTVLEAYHQLQRCNQILIGKQIDQVFKKYVEE